ncbi:hypothetical protein CAPTEDRAFT_169679 [Capitella teleta]|uniref:AAA+ ATPase domain-containing protein n=1 Tax=Capitella teleta TaxID=283909 RepID=R7U9U9_CAPTE|nr:hypothetical protein CAPTEDRAFT_169679 [Capitella teleta]|eukprot:ELU02896.1 hypothetical protein CAPTEDRAFT_169679 [Capitella teleta]
MTGRSKKVPQVTQSTVKFADLGGIDSTLKEVCKLLVHMKHPEVYEQLGVTPPRGFLLHGPPGCGKTLLAHAIAGELELPFIKMAATEIVSGVSGESEEKLRSVFENAMSSAPCILFLDEIDSITPKRETASKDMERRIVSQLLSCMDDLSSKISAHVLVIGATNRPDSIDPALRRAGRFDREISMGIPNEAARQRILEVLCRSLKVGPDFDYLGLAHLTPGYVGADLMALVREAAITAVNRAFKSLQESEAFSKSSSEKVTSVPPVAVEGPLEAISEEESAKENGETVEKGTAAKEAVAEEAVAMEISDAPSQEPPQEPPKEEGYQSVLSWLKGSAPLNQEQLEALFITISDFERALKHVQPSAKREGFATVPDVTWDDIGALHKIREELQMAILAPVKHREQFKSLGLNNPPGILLAGPPGCGKTLLAKAVANESGVNFISVKGPELLNMYVGESERAVRQVFQRARNSSPCVIFFDELDALCPRRSDSGEGGSSVRVVNQLLTEMDGLEERKNVFIMGATNRPDIVDPAVLRPGRLDKTLYVGLPTAADRFDILRTITKNGTKPLLGSDVILEDIANKESCSFYTGADLAALVREASVSALREFFSSKDQIKTITVHQRHFERALERVRPSVSAKDQVVYDKMKARFQVL